MKSDVGAKGQLDAQLIPGPNHKTVARISFVSAMLLLLALAGLVFLFVSLVNEMRAGHWWWAVTSFVIVLTVWITTYQAPQKD